MSEVVRISHYLTQHPHCMGKLRPKHTYGIKLLDSRSLISQPFPPNLKVSSSVPPSSCAPALACYAPPYAPPVSRPSGACALPAWASDPLASCCRLFQPHPPQDALTDLSSPTVLWQQPIASPLSSQGTVLSLTRPFSQSTSLSSSSSQTAAAGRALTV